MLPTPGQPGSSTPVGVAPAPSDGLRPSVLAAQALAPDGVKANVRSGGSQHPSGAIRKAFPKGKSSGGSKKRTDTMGLGVPYVPLKSLEKRDSQIGWLPPDGFASASCLNRMQNVIAARVNEYSKENRSWERYDQAKERIVNTYYAAAKRQSDKYAQMGQIEPETEEDVRKRISDEYDETNWPRDKDGKFIKRAVQPTLEPTGPKVPDELKALMDDAKVTPMALQAFSQSPMMGVTKSAFFTHVVPKLIQLTLVDEPILMYPAGQGENLTTKWVVGEVVYHSKPAKELAGITHTIMGVPFVWGVGANGARVLTLAPYEFMKNMDPNIHAAAMWLWTIKVLQLGTVTKTRAGPPKTGDPSGSDPIAMTAAMGRHKAVSLRSIAPVEAARLAYVVQSYPPESVEAQVTALIAQKRRMSRGGSGAMTPVDHTYAEYLISGVKKGVISLSRLDGCKTVANMLKELSSAWQAHEFKHVSRRATAKGVHALEAIKAGNVSAYSVASTADDSTYGSSEPGTCESAMDDDTAHDRLVDRLKYHKDVTPGFAECLEAYGGVPGVLDTWTNELVPVIATVGAIGPATPEGAYAMSGLYSAVAEQGTAAQWQDTAAALAHVAAIIGQAANDRQLKESQLSAINRFIASETRTESQSSQQAYSEADATSSAISCELPQDCLNAGRAGKIYREIADMIDGERIDAIQMWTKVDDSGNTVRRLAKDALNEGIVICDDYNKDVFYDTCVEYVLAEISADITTPLYSIRDSIRRWNKVFRDMYPEGTTQYAPIGAVSGSNCRHQPALTGTGTASTVKSPSVSKPVEEDKPTDPVGPEDHDDVK